MSSFKSEVPGNLQSGSIAWMASNPVAANFLMLVLLLGGFFVLQNTTKEVFPSFDLDSITVSVSYPGASPAEVEQAILLALENAVADVDGLDQIQSTAREGAAQLTAEILDANDRIRILQDVKTAIDAISTFPLEVENLIVKLNSRRRSVLELALYGDVNEHALKSAADLLSAKLESNPSIGAVAVSGTRDLEIYVEVSQDNLRRYDLTLEDVSDQIRKIAIELGGGSLKTQAGEILVRMNERRHTANDFNNIPIITKTDGSLVRLGDIAKVSEGFEDSQSSASYNGKRAVVLDVFRIGDQTPNSVAAAVYDELDNIGNLLPQALAIGIIDDDAVLFSQRAELLLKNGLWGLLLVVLFLALFLDVRLAVWVSMGIPISFMGAFLLFPITDFSINIVSMFAFIISLGIVVDDAVISGENIFHYRELGFNPLQASILGAKEMALPIIISIATNIIAFLPLLFIPGILGKVFSVIPIVVIAVFLISLIESLLILPAHLSHQQASGNVTKKNHLLLKAKARFNHLFDHFVQHQYVSFIRSVISYRYLTVSLFIAALLVVGAYALSGRMGMTLFPKVESDFAFAAATLEIGAPEQEVNRIKNLLVSSGQQVINDHTSDKGEQTLSTGIYAEVNQNAVQVRVFLTEASVRPISTTAFSNQWRKAAGNISGVETLTFQSNRGGPGSGKAFTLELSHTDTSALNQAAERLAVALADFDVVKDIDNGTARGKKQYEFSMKDLGYTLGFTTADIARQVRGAFYGYEALRQQRGVDEIRVLVRLPENERTSVHFLKNMILRSPAGVEVLLSDVVHLDEGRAYTTINRRDGKRVIRVTADVEPSERANQIIEAIRQSTLPNLVRQFPGLDFSFQGRQAEIKESNTSLAWGILAVMFAIYTLVGILFRSYVQPIMVLIAIPFSAVGAIVGHLVMGYSLSIMSLFGMMALAGVVVNNALILIDFANRKVQAGQGLSESVIAASVQRFRPIILTTLTTFVGLAPMIFETSRQARFLIPMALSLGFGILIATFVTLAFLPALYFVIHDIKTIVGKVKGIN